MTATLSPDDARALQQATRACARAEQAAQLAIARARLPLLEAVAARTDLIDTLAARYGLDPDQPFEFDAATGQVEQPAKLDRVAAPQGGPLPAQAAGPGDARSLASRAALRSVEG